MSNLAIDSDSLRSRVMAGPVVAEIGGKVRKTPAAAAMIKTATAVATVTDGSSRYVRKAKTAERILEQSVLKNNNFLLTHI